MIKTTIPLKIEVTSSRDESDSFTRLWKLLFNKTLETESVKFKIILDFSKCNYIGMNTTVIIGAFCYYMESLGHNIEIKTDTMNESVYSKSISMGFIQSFRTTLQQSNNETVIPYKRFINKRSESEVLDYLESDWLSRNRLTFSKEVKDAVLSSLWEIFANAFEHGKSNHGVFTCGTYDKKTRTLQLIVGDIGIGLTNAVNQFLTKKLSSKEAIKWAIIRGNSTHTAELESGSKAKPRGLGLDILKQLVDVTEGFMEIYTGDIIYKRISTEDSYFFTNNEHLKGTWVKISLVCKEGVAYQFEHEGPAYF